MIGIVFINDIGYCPYLAKYTDTLKRLGKDYELIFWDREPSKGRSYPEQNYHILKLASREDKHPLFKIKDFLKFKQFAEQKIRERGYEKLIILTSITGVFLYPLLTGKYRNRFVFDYRDASYEYLPPFRRLLGDIAAASRFACISSKGFLEILPPRSDYVMAHNFKYADLENLADSFTASKELPIQVSFIGLLRDAYILDLIDVFAKDPRFVLNFHGCGELLDAAKRHAAGLENIRFTGEYREGEKLQFIRQADLLCVNYASSFNNDLLVANKFYDALIYKKPLLGNLHTYQGRLITENGLGISLDMQAPDFTQRLFEYVTQLDGEQFCQNAARVLAQVLEEDAHYIKKIEDFAET